MSFEWFVALRYLSARRKQAFISVISLISCVGVAVGVMALLIVLALMTGLQSELRDRIIGSQAHAYVYKIGGGGFGDQAQEVKRLLTVPHVVGAAPVVLGQGLARAGDAAEFIVVKGIDPALEPTVTNVGRAMRQGSLDALVPTPASASLPGIVIGKDLAEKLQVRVNDAVQVMTVEGPLTPFGMQPGRRDFKVVGIFNLGLYEYDSTFGLVHVQVAQRMFERTRPDYYELRLDDLFQAKHVAESVPLTLGQDYSGHDWLEQNGALFRALWLEKMAMSITIGLIVMVAALNIIATMILLVMEKTRDIAILKTMGSSSAVIRRIFVLQGLVIGLIGTAVGAIGGVSLVYVLDRYKLIHIETEVYQISYVPFRLEPLDFTVVVLAAVLICFVATLYPSRQASRLDPAEALRYQ
jgi:lipoprotein-releasing system permease protein